MAVKGKVIYVGPDNGRGVRVGVRSPDGLTWWWTQKGKALRKGEIVVVPQGAKPEPGRGTATKPRELDLEVRRMVRAVALKAASLVLSGKGPNPEEVISLAEKFVLWLSK